MKDCYWNHTGKYNDLTNKLEKLIPCEGSVSNPLKNKKLEKYRKAANCYYDLYNNGLCNRAQSFAKIFKVSSRKYGSYRYGFSERLYEIVEAEMDKIVLEAAAEQKLIETV